MTKEDFEKEYAKKSNVTVEWLHKKHEGAIPCECGEEGCKGWQMVNLINKKGECMNLSVMDRLLILNLDTLPKMGTILTMRIKQQLINEVGFKESEIKDFEIRQDGEKIKWKSDAEAVDIEIGDEAKKLLIDALDKSENLNENYIGLYDRLKGNE